MRSGFVIEETVVDIQLRYITEIAPDGVIDEIFERLHESQEIRDFILSAEVVDELTQIDINKTFFRLISCSTHKIVICA